MKSILKSKYPDIEEDKLTIFYITASDVLVGELHAYSPDDGFFTVKDPKKIYRITRPVRANDASSFTVDYVLGDMDVLESGVVKLKPVAYYSVNKMDEEGSMLIYALLIEHAEKKAMLRAQRAGLHLPQSGLVGKF